MALNVFELFGKIAIDNSEAERGLDKTVGHAKDAENALAKTFKRIGGFVAAAFSVKAVIDFGRTCTQVYADVAAEQAAFAQIMGDYSGVAQDKLDAVAEKTGITATRMTGAFNSMTAKFMGLGYSVEDATTLATDGLMIAADASAFWNMSLDEAMAHLNSFINGSYEGGEAIGLFANDTQMAAYAVQQGFVADAAAWAQLDEATKQAIRLNFARAMQESSGVTGQAANEADAYANVMANLAEAWRQFQAIIGKPILERIVLPAMRKLNEFMPIVNEAVQKGIDWLTEGFDKIAAYFSEVFTEDGMDMNAFPNALRNMFRDAARSIPALLSSVGRSIRSAWVNTVWPAVQKYVKLAFGVELPEWSKIKSAVADWWNGENGIAAQIANVCNWTLKLFGVPADVEAEDVETILDSWWTNTKGLVEGFCAWTLKLFNNPVEAYKEVKEAVDGWWSGVKAGAEDALVWALKLFGVPAAKAEGVKTLVSSWWQGVKQAAQDALIWTLQLFENPKETAGTVATKISTWWAGVAASAQSALNWVLQLFDNPKETGEQVGTFVKDWWDGVKSDAEAALIWTLKLFGVPAAKANGVRNLVSGWWQGVKIAAQSALNWAIGIFDLPEAKGDDGVIATITNWWEGIRTSLESVLAIDLSGIDVAGIFTAADTAIDKFIENAKTFASDVAKSISYDIHGRLQLGMTLSNLFDAGVNAIGNLLGIASTLVGDIVSEITGDSEAAEKIGGVFDNLFGWASEMVIGVKNGAIEAFDWLLRNESNLLRAIGGIAGAMLGLSLTNPAIAALEAVVALIAIMTTDWENFEQKYPELTTMLEELTGLDFTDVANSLNSFKSTLGEVFTFLETHSLAVDMLLMIAGAIAIGTGHPLMGAAFVTAGGFSVWNEALAIQEANRAAGYTDATAPENYLHYAMEMYRTPGVYGFTENELDDFINVLKTLNPSEEGYHEAATAVVEAWMRVNGPSVSEENGGSRRYGPEEDGGDDGNPYDFSGKSSPINNFNPTNNTFQTLQAMMTQIKQDVMAGTQEGLAAGLGDVTLDVKVTTGNVVLNDGTLVGSLTPKIDAALGARAALSGRKWG